MKKLLFLLPLFFFTGVANANDAGLSKDAGVTVTTTDGGVEGSQKEITAKDAIDTGKNVFSAFKNGKYREAIAGLITLLIFLWRRFASKFVISKLSPWWVGFVTVLIGYVGTIPEALSAGDFHWWTFVWGGLLTSSEAMLMWQMVGKKALPKVFGDKTVPS